MSIILGVFTVLILALLLSPCLGAAEPTQTPAVGKTLPFPVRGDTTQKTTPVPVRSMSKEEIRKALERIEKSDAPKPMMGAMCYKMAMPPNTVDYLCPTCGGKTHYANDAVARRIAWDLEASRRLVDIIRKSTGADVSLDETGFCAECAAKGAQPELAVIIKFKDGSTKRTSPVTPDDLRLLQAFFAGDLSSKTSNDGSNPLKPGLPRLRELLGETK